jgi:ATP-dependent DNA helicase RecG
MIDRYDIQALQQQAEGQQFDRKSFRIEPKALAVIAVTFANADRGDIVIVEFMREYKLVKEFGEGVDRMFREMAEAGNPAPEYKQVEFMVKVRLNSALRDENGTEQKGGQDKIRENGTQELGSDQKKDQKSTKWPENVLEKTLNKEVQLTERQAKIINRLKETGKMNVLENILENVLETSASLASYLGVNERTIRRDLQFLQKQGIIQHVGPDKGGHWEVIAQDEKGEKQ